MKHFPNDGSALILYAACNNEHPEAPKQGPDFSSTAPAGHLPHTESEVACLVYRPRSHTHSLVCRNVPQLGPSLYACPAPWLCSFHQGTRLIFSALKSELPLGLVVADRLWRRDLASRDLENTHWLLDHCLLDRDKTCWRPRHKTRPYLSPRLTKGQAKAAKPPY